MYQGHHELESEFILKIIIVIITIIIIIIIAIISSSTCLPVGFYDSIMCPRCIVWLCMQLLRLCDAGRASQLILSITAV